MKKILLLLSIIGYSMVATAQVIEILYEEKIILGEGAYKNFEPFIRKILFENNKKDKGYVFKLTHFKGKSIYQLANEIPDEFINIDGDVTSTKINDGQKNYIMYKDQFQKKMVEQMSFFFKKILVKDTLENFEWTITDEKKQIGKYTCTKATLPKSIKMVWYAEDIPINDGPREYWGLPGMILQIESVNKKGASYSITAKSIMFHNSKVELTPPTKGKIITRKEYENIRNEKINSASTSLDFDKN